MAEADGAFLEAFDADEQRASSRRCASPSCVGRFYEDLAQRLRGRGAARASSSPACRPARSSTTRSPAPTSCPSRRSCSPRPADFAGVACLGVVIRGETDHFDFVCAESARGIQDVQLETGVPCAFGVITCDTMEQALARAGGDKRDQGRNAALTVARMALLKRRVA